MQEKCIHDCHDSRAAGHLGQFKTLEKLRQSVIWSNMTRDSKLHVKTCAVCNKQKKPTRSVKAKLEQYHAGFPMERIHMYILGSLMVSKKGNKYLLMIVDQFTKWLECFPIANQTAEVVSKVLVDNVFSRLGCPIEIHTDQGKNMDGNLVRQLCGLLQIAKTITTHYHP